MKDNIHPVYESREFKCVGCGHVFNVRTTLTDNQQLGVCSNCHPFFTGKHRFVDTAGRVEKFRRKYAAQQGKAAS